MGYTQNRLTTSIYDLALGRGHWEDIVDILSSNFPDCLVQVCADDLAGPRNIGLLQRGLEPAAAAEYTTIYAAQNPWLEPLGDLPLFQVYQDNQLLDRKEAAKTPFVSDWLSRQGAFSAATGVTILRNGTRQLTVEIRYPEGADDIRERATRVLGEAAPHFGRAFEILARGRFASGGGYIDSLVDDLPFSVFFVSEDMRIQYCNAQANAMRLHNTGPFSTSDGFLRALDRDADAHLRQMVGKVAASKRAPTSVLQIPPANGDARQFVMARQAAQNTHSFGLHDLVLGTGPLVMLVVHGGGETASLPLDLLWRAFSLTDAEANLTEALVNGDTLADFAKKSAVSKQTLRNQLVGVMRKTGTKRQSELVALLTRLSFSCI